MRRCPDCKHYTVDHTSNGCFWGCGCELTSQQVMELVQREKEGLDKPDQKG